MRMRISPILHRSFVFPPLHLQSVDFQKAIIRQRAYYFCFHSHHLSSTQHTSPPYHSTNPIILSSIPPPSINLKPIILFLILILRIHLTNIPLQHNLGILLHRLLTILIMIHPLLTITFDNITTEKTDGFVGNLTFTCALFDGLEVFDWIFCSAKPILLFVVSVRNK